MVFVGSFDGNFYAVDIQTGEERWRFQTGDEVRRTSTTADGLIYFPSRDGNLYALDAETGAERWRFSDKLGVHDPTVIDQVLYFWNHDGNFYALDVKPVP
jgi:outer membrane protein assembly factor BamB